MRGPLSRRAPTDKPTRFRGVAGVIVFLVFIASLIGCSPAYEVRVPAGFAVSSNMSDLREALVPGGGVSGRRVAIVAHENGAQRSFEICGDGSESGERICRELAFTETGLARALDEVIETASERSRVERVFIVTDYRRRSVCDRFDTNTDGGVSISCTSRGRDEPLDGFVDAIVQQIDTTTDLVVSVLAEDSIALIRRLGFSGAGAGEHPGEDTREGAREAGGVVPELLLPGAGARLHAAGYPVPASIAYDFSGIFPLIGANGGESPPVYVPYAVFRY